MGRGVAQTDSRRLSNAAARVHARVGYSEICCGKGATGLGFFRVLWFLLPMLTPPTAPHSVSSMVWGSYSRPNNGRITEWAQANLTPRD
jgi:hypothetical protein